MSWFVKREEIVEKLKDHKLYHGDELITYSLYKQGIPGYPKASMIINRARYGMWLAISKEDVKILPVSFFTGKLTDTVLVVNTEDMVEFTLEKGVFYYNLTIKTKDDKVIIFNIGRVLAGDKEHHEDLMKLVERFKNRK